MPIRPVLKPKVVKDPEWLKVVRTMPCINHNHDTLYDGIGRHCDYGTTIGKGPCEASHLKGKSSDHLCVPMCGGCHRTGPFAWHNGKQTFLKHFRWTEEALLAHAEALYQSFKEGK